MLLVLTNPILPRPIQLCPVRADTALCSHTPPSPILTCQRVARQRLVKHPAIRATVGRKFIARC
jgi:hypothetical protein